MNGSFAPIVHPFRTQVDCGTESFIPHNGGRKQSKERASPFASTTMSIATYRGIAYDTDVRKLNHLAIIKRQLEKAQAQHDAVMAQTTKSVCYTAQ